MEQNSMAPKEFESKQKDIDIPPADFEIAIESAGFGLFNILLLSIALFAAGATVFETSTMSYILPSAECDLRLTLIDKGILNAITYAGMITSAIGWGYLADTKGRKKILVFGYLVNGFCVIGGALSQNVVQLMIFKYFGGFVSCGPFAVLMSYLTELHGKNNRNRIMLLIGMKFIVASLLLPLLAILILPNEWNFKIFDLTFHSWQIFLAVTSIPSFLSGSVLALFPESPKFLMSQGRNKEALEAFKTIYALNKHKPRESYPIKHLVAEVLEKDIKNFAHPETGATVDLPVEYDRHSTHRSAMEAFRQGLKQLRPLFVKPYLLLSLQVYLMNFCILLGQNTVRLWLPQLFASITEFELKSKGDTTMCDILEYSVNKTEIMEGYDELSTCEVVITVESYTNNIVVALCGLCGYLVAGSVVNTIGGKWILIIGLTIAGTCGITLYWSSSSLMILILSALFVTMGSIASTSVISASVNLFPTSLRTMIVSLTMMCGRSGSLLGNILFPTFIALGCIPPFLMIGFVMLFACFLSFFLPDTKRMELK